MRPINDLSNVYSFIIITFFITLSLFETLSLGPSKCCLPPDPCPLLFTLSSFLRFLSLSPDLCLSERSVDPDLSGIPASFFYSLFKI
jgi:hypothetical protein